MTNYVQVAGAVSANNNTTPKVAVATCPVGTQVMGGGGIVVNNGSGTVSLTVSVPTANTVWSATADRQSGSGNWTLQAYAICATFS